MLFQPANDIFFLLDQSVFGINIKNRIAAASVAFDRILAVIQIRADCNGDSAAFGSALDEIITIIIKMIEQRPGDGFDDGGFTRAVGTTNRRYASIKFLRILGVIFDVPDFNFGN